MPRRWPVFILIASLLAAIAPLQAHEPDGRFVLRSVWVSDAAPGSARSLRVTVTPVVAVKDVRVSAAIPDSAIVSIRSLRLPAGNPLATAEGRWPGSGFALGDLPPGVTVTFDLDVVEPPDGGGILAIGVDAIAGGRTIHEGEGITLGRPGVPPVMRGDIAEFPAEAVPPAP